jgi:hypothetical protein
MGEPIAPPGTHIISCHVMQRDWSVTFSESADPTAKFPWLLCDSHDDVLKILQWGHTSGPDLDEHHRNMKRWGVGGGRLQLSTIERLQLIARGRGWPWNGYELKRMKEAGMYPPQRLTPALEAEYHRRAADKAARRHHRA